MLLGGKMTQDNPTHVAGFTIQTSIEFGAFGRSYVGFHSQEGRRILKILRDGEDVAVSDDELTKLKEDASFLSFEPRQQTEQGHRILVAHFYQAASFGLLVGGSELQKGCEKTLRELDPNGEAMQTLRGTTLQQRLELLKQVAQRVEQLHAEKKQFPFITPWNIMLSDARPKLVDLGLGYLPEKLDTQQVHEDVLAYYAPEVLRALAQKQAIQVGPAADVYALGLSMRSILLERVAEAEGAQAAPAAPGAAPAAAAPIGLGKREALLAGKPWKKVPQEKISRRLESLLARAAAHEPGRRPTAAQLVKELDSILKDKDITWSPPSQAPKFVVAVVAVLAIAAGVVWAMLPPAAEAAAKSAYVRATEAKTPDEALKALDDESAKIPPDVLKAHPELGRARAMALLAKAQAGGDKAPAIEALLAYAETGGVDPADVMAARLIAGFMLRWGGLEQEKSKAILELVANSTADGAKELPELARAAVKVWPFGTEGEIKPEDVKKWSEQATLARGVDSALERGWMPSGAAWEKVNPKPQAISWKAKWIPTALLGRLKDLTPTDDGKAELQAAKDAFPCFATQGAWALHLARFAKDEKDIDLAKKEIEAAAKLKKDNQTFAEGSVALADLSLKQAATAKDQVAAYKTAKTAYVQAALEKPATPGLDLKAACTRGQLFAGARSGIAVGLMVANGSAPSEGAVLREAETGLTEYLDAAQKDAKNAELNALAADAHVALGLVIQAQPNRFPPEWVEHLHFAFKDADLVGQHTYRLTDSPANGVTSKLLFEQAKKDFTANATSEKPDRERSQQLLAQIEALCKLEKFDTSFMSATTAQYYRNEANGLKGKKRIEALRAAATAFQGVFGNDGSWQAGLEGTVEALGTIADESDDTKDAGKALTDAQLFLDKSTDALKARKITGKEVTAAVNAQKLVVRKKWFTVLGKWLNTKGDQADFSQQDDQDFATTLFNVAEGPGAPELEGTARAQVAQLHWLFGKWCYDQKNYTVAAANLATAVEGLPPEKDVLQSQAALLAADVALTKAENVRADESPWHGGVKEAANWGRDVLAKRLGFQGFKQLFDAARQNKLTLIKDEAAAKRLVEDILKNEDSVSAEDLGAAAIIYGKSAKAQLLLARAKHKANAKDDARSAAKKAIELSDAQQPDVIVEAASLWCVNTGADDMTTADFKIIVDKAIASKDAAATKLKGDGARYKFSFVGLYWLGRYHQAQADEKSNAKQDAEAKKAYGDAQKSYNDYIKAVQEAGADRPPEAQDADTRARKCGIAANS